MIILPIPKLSKTLEQLRDIAITITKDRRISVIWDEKIPTASIDLKNLVIRISDNCLPKGIKNYPKTYNKLLDGLVSHEGGHYSVTRPVESRYERLENSKKRRKLAHLIVNIVEDKRVNHFIEKRYRFDLGKRLFYLRKVMRESGANSIAKMIENGNMKTSCKPAIMVNILITKGLYDGEPREEMWKELTEEQIVDTKECLSLMERAKYTWVKHDLVKICDTVFELINKHVKPQDNVHKLVPMNIEDGELGLDLSEDQEEEMEKDEEGEGGDESDEEDIKDGGGAGISFGEEIPAPDPNYNRYFEYVDRNSLEITRLLNKLKQFIKPIVHRAIFQKHGRIMAPVLAKAYVKSLSRPVNRIYQRAIMEFEKQKVALGFVIDFSGSMDYSVACDVVTIMNEVFGSWLDDESFSILVFGGDFQKIKTFFEQFSNTRARIGGISVDSGATMGENPLEEMRKMFNAITKEKQKILVLCSDFWFGDDAETERVIERMAREGITILFIGLCHGQKVRDVAPNVTNIFRTYCDNVRDLPEFFIDVYMKSIQNTRR